MADFPLPLMQMFGPPLVYVVYLGIGFAFGFVLEIAGFGQSTKLAAQFYLKDWTVFKVFFTTIIVAMVAIFLSTALGVLDYNLIYVNETYVWPGIVGGLIMGVGFIIGGFCPGTSLVAMATAKVDGIFFVVGAFFGIFLFGETASYIDEFWHSSNLGRFTLQDLFGVDAGVVVVVIVVIALALFVIAEQSERIFGGRDLAKEPRWRYAAAIAIFGLAIVVLVLGQPTNADKQLAIADEMMPKVTERAIYAHPGEVLDMLNDDKLNPILIDVRNEAEYNLFHIRDARHVPIDELLDHTDELIAEPANSVLFLMGNGEELATEAWWMLVAEGVPNVYVLEGGVNNWITTFAEPDFVEENQLVANVGEDQLAFTFASALGSRVPFATPKPDTPIEYESKVVLQTKRAPAAGGCG